MPSKITYQQAKQAFHQGKNIMEMFRKSDREDVNSNQAILTAYDLQAGSYISKLKSKKFHEYLINYSRALYKVIQPFKFNSILEAGVGEATTFVNLIKHIPKPNELTLAGFDISWSRVAMGKKFCVDNNINQVKLSTGNYLHTTHGGQ